MSVAIQNRQRTVKIRTPWLKVRLKRLMRYLECADRELSVVFVNDRVMQELNHTYRQRAYTTNVLAFPQETGWPGELPTAVLGDVVVSLPTASREAETLQQSVEDYVLYLLIHGLLHLLGYDHERSAEEHQRMQAREQELLEMLQH
jgi:probable rRNA maturation factor